MLALPEKQTFMLNVIRAITLNIDYEKPRTNNR